MLYIHGRLDQINDSMNELERYVLGTEVSLELRAVLGAKVLMGDLEAHKELELLEFAQEARRTPLIVEIKENFGNGYGALDLSIDCAVAVLSRT